MLQINPTSNFVKMSLRDLALCYRKVILPCQIEANKLLCVSLARQCSPKVSLLTNTLYFKLKLIRLETQWPSLNQCMCSHTK